LRNNCIRHRQWSDESIRRKHRHDFNNLLTIIHDNTKSMLTDESKLGEQNRQYLKHVIAAAENATNLIRQLLAFGRKQAIQFQSPI